MFASRAYFSFTEITDAARHRDHNEWHQLDHRPENLVLPGVAWGDRWVRSPDCAAASSVVAPDYANVHYAIMYWFREPLEETLDDWFRLSELSFQWGRSPQIGWTRRPLRSLFVPLRGQAAPRTGVSADVIPFRPVRGLYVTISRLHGFGSLTREMLRWYDDVHIPNLLGCRGVAGAWTFVSENAFASAREMTGWRFADAASRSDETAPLRLQILYLDEDPLEVTADLEASRVTWCAAGRGRQTRDAEELIFAGPLRRVLPWQWNWFCSVPVRGDGNRV